MDADEDVQWRRLDGRLWTATRDGQPLGTVERALFGVTAAFGIGAVAGIGYAIAAGLF